MSFDITKFSMSQRELAVVSKHFMPAHQRAAMVATNGEQATAAYEREANAQLAEAILPEVRRGLAEGAAQGAAAERARCRAIIESPEGMANQRAAVLLATQTDMEPEAAKQLLATLHGAATPAKPQTGAVDWGAIAGELTSASAGDNGREAGSLGEVA